MVNAGNEGILKQQKKNTMEGRFKADGFGTQNGNERTNDGVIIILSALEQPGFVDRAFFCFGCVVFVWTKEKKFPTEPINDARD